MAQSCQKAFELPASLQSNSNKFPVASSTVTSEQRRCLQWLETIVAVHAGQLAASDSVVPAVAAAAAIFPLRVASAAARPSS